MQFTSPDGSRQPSPVTVEFNGTKINVFNSKIHPKYAEVRIALIDAGWSVDQYPCNDVLTVSNWDASEDIFLKVAQEIRDVFGCDQ